MGFMSGYSEPPAIDVEEPREERPSYEELLQANETLARKVSLLTTRNLILEDENRYLKQRSGGNH